MVCISDDNFYLSIDELIAICLVESVNVAVFEEEGGVLKYAGGFFEAPGCVTCCKLRSNRLQRVRSHFERIITAMQLQDLAHEYCRAPADAVFAEEVQSWYDEEACNDRKLIPTVDAATNAAPPASLTPAAYPPAPLPHESARPRKRLRSKTAVEHLVGSNHKKASTLTAALDTMRKIQSASLKKAQRRQSQKNSSSLTYRRWPTDQTSGVDSRWR